MAALLTSPAKKASPKNKAASPAPAKPKPSPYFAAPAATAATSGMDFFEDSGTGNDSDHADQEEEEQRQPEDVAEAEEEDEEDSLAARLAARVGDESQRRSRKQPELYKATPATGRKATIHENMAPAESLQPATPSEKDAPSTQEAEVTTKKKPGRPKGNPKKAPKPSPAPLREKPPKEAKLRSKPTKKAPKKAKATAPRPAPKAHKESKPVVVDLTVGPTQAVVPDEVKDAKGDNFEVTRSRTSGRIRMKPLAFWNHDRVEYDEEGGIKEVSFLTPGKERYDSRGKTRPSSKRSGARAASSRSLEELKSLGDQKSAKRRRGDTGTPMGKFGLMSTSRPNEDESPGLLRTKKRPRDHEAEGDAEDDEEDEDDEEEKAAAKKKRKKLKSRKEREFEARKREEARKRAEIPFRSAAPARAGHGASPRDLGCRQCQNPSLKTRHTCERASPPGKRARPKSPAVKAAAKAPKAAPKKPTVATRLPQQPAEDVGPDPAEANGWTKAESRSLSQAYMEANPTERNFWKAVAKMVPGRTPQECMDQFNALNATPPKKEKPKTRAAKEASKPNDPQPAKIAGKGTMKRKQQARAALEAADEGHDDDIFAGVATPHALRGHRGGFSDVEEVPMGRGARGAAQRGVSPGVAGGSGESPGILKKVDRNKMDSYVHQLKQGKGSKRQAGAKAKGGKQAPKRKAKSVVVSVARSPGVQSDGEDAQYGEDQLNGDEGYYWSDAE